MYDGKWKIGFCLNFNHFTHTFYIENLFTVFLNNLFCLIAA